MTMLVTMRATAQMYCIFFVAVIRLLHVEVYHLTASGSTACCNEDITQNLQYSLKNFHCCLLSRELFFFQEFENLRIFLFPTFQEALN